MALSPARPDDDEELEADRLDTERKQEVRRGRQRAARAQAANSAGPGTVRRPASDSGFYLMIANNP